MIGAHALQMGVGTVGSSIGKVKWFNDQKGFGFISGESGQDIFVHHTSIVADGFRTLKEGETVEFETENGPKGLKAINVRRLEAVVAGPAKSRESLSGD